MDTVSEQIKPVYGARKALAGLFTFLAVVLAFIVTAGSFLDAYSYGRYAYSTCGNAFMTAQVELTIVHPCLLVAIGVSWWFAKATFVGTLVCHWTVLIAGSTWLGCLIAMLLF
jgi:hypothetical protein